MLASSRPDLIEVDLKRPGRIDVKIPLFPTTTAREGFDLVRALCRKKELNIPESGFKTVEELLPKLLTPAAAEALAVKSYRIVRTTGAKALDALKEGLTGYQTPISTEVLENQIQLAIREATDPSFIPPFFS